METLDRQQIEAALAELGDWAYEGGELTRTFRFHDFSGSVEFVERLAEVAEGMQHHPDIDIRYNKVILHVVTHSAGGVTQKDLDLAEAVGHIA
jgi:4a-hydroxytetrahydrobiopterin dehydratase